jgi:hypothetical protein
MITVLEGIENSLEQFPDEGRLCSANIDPNPLLNFSIHIKNGLDICRLSLQYYSRTNPDLYWEQPDILDDDGRVMQRAKRIKPWLNHGKEEWFARRDRLMRAMVTYYDVLMTDYDDLAAARDEKVPRKRYRPMDLMYALNAHLLLCALGKMPKDERKELLTAPNAYAHKHKLLQHPNTPVMCLTAEQLLCTIKWVGECWKDLKYHQLLESYLLQLEMRAAHLLLYCDTSQVHDSEDYRRPAGGNLYAPNDLFLGTLAAVSVSMHNNFFMVHYLPPKTRSFPLGEGTLDALRHWFLNKATKAKVKIASAWVRENYIAGNLWPAERELYVLENPRDASASAMQILKKHRPDDKQADAAAENSYVIKGRRAIKYSALIREANQSPADIIQQFLDEKKPIDELGDESLLVQLAMMEMISNEITNTWALDWAEYCTLEKDFPDQCEGILREYDRPRVVQMFHYFQFVFHGRIYWVDSFLTSVCIWFHVVATTRPSPDASIQLRPFHLTGLITLEQLMIDIFGKVPFCRENWWNGQVPGEEDRAVMEAAGKGLVF